MRSKQFWSFNVVVACLAISCVPTQKISAPENRLAYRQELSEVDRFGNVYLINYENEIIKYDENDEQFGYYSNNTLGDIGLLDVTNPLKVMAFYPAFYTCIFLDRQLRETIRINFIELGLGEIHTAATGNEGALWIFDYNEQRMKSINPKGEELLTTNDFRLLFEKTIQVVRIKQWGDEVYVQTQQNGLLVFDLFGYYKKTIVTDGLVSFQWVDETLFLVYPESIETYSRVDLRTEEFAQTQDFDSKTCLLTRNEFVLVSDSTYQRHPLAELPR